MIDDESGTPRLVGRQRSKGVSSFQNQAASEEMKLEKG